MATIQETISGMLMRPLEFYKSIEKDNDFVKPMLYFAVTSIIVYIFGFLIYIPLGVTNPLETIFSFFFAVVLLPFSIGYMFAAPFVSAGIAHLGLMILGVRTEYIKTFKPISYSGIPGAAYSLFVICLSIVFYAVFPITDEERLVAMLSTGAVWIFVGFIIIMIFIAVIRKIHVLITETIGIAYYHNISRLKAFLGLILIPTILTILMLFIIGLFIGLLISFVSSSVGDVTGMVSSYF